MERFGFDEKSRELHENGSHDKKDEAEEDEYEDLDREELREYRAVVARVNYIGQDSPDLQSPAKEAETWRSQREGVGAG